MSRIINRRTLLLIGSCLLLLHVPLLWRAYLTVSQPASADFPDGDQASSRIDEGAFHCDNRNVDYGKVRIGQPVRHTFQLSNTSPETRRIEKVIPACSCCKVDHFSKDVAPGAVGEVAVVLDTTGNPGIRQSSVLIVTDDPKVPRLNPLVSCEVLPAVETVPKQLRFVLRGSAAVFPSQRIEVVGLYQDEKIALGDIQVSDPMILVTKPKNKRNEPLHFDATIDKKMPAGLTLAHLIIHVEGSAQKTVRFPMTITNELKMKAEPALLELPAGKDSRQTVEFTVRTLDNSPLEVNEVELADRAIQVVTQRVAASAVTVRLEDVTVSRDLNLKHICVSTNHGELRVPITIQAHKNK